ncbi:DUF6907 domain-containing protein [Streptomyces sp. MN13]
MAKSAISQHVGACIGAIPSQPTAATVHPLPAVEPGHRLAPVKVVTGTASIIAHIPDPLFCTEDHVDQPVRALEDVMHRGDVVSVVVPTFGYGAYPVQMHAWIESDPVATDARFKAAHIAIGDASGDEGSHITPEMADKLADDLIGFAAELRHMANDARRANAVAPQLSLRKRQGGAA